ncbi:LOW QUALITY PROTEIN: hypothetical protein HID58_080282, partial [Brassica napus]
PLVGFFSKTLSTNPRKNGRRTTLPDQSTGEEDPTMVWKLTSLATVFMPLHYQDRMEACRCRSTVELCFLIFWEANVKKAGGSKHTSSVYAVSGFDVTRSNLSFKLSDSPLSIRLGDLTAFFQITTPIHVELAVANKTDEAVFVSFDGDITKLTNIGVAESGHIHAASIENPKDSQPPLLVTNLMGKTNTFHLRLTLVLLSIRPSRFSAFSTSLTGGTGGPLNDMSGASSLTTKVCAIPTVDDNEPAGETIAGCASATDLLIPTSSKATRKARLD